jgi:excisionase family DNA binding protein
LPSKNHPESVRLTSRDIAVYCQVSKNTVLEWIKSGILKAFRLPSGHYRIDKKEVRKNNIRILFSDRARLILKNIRF